MQFVLSVFVGYLGTAAPFVFRHEEREDSTAKIGDRSPLGRLLIIGPVIVFALA